MNVTVTAGRGLSEVPGKSDQEQLSDPHFGGKSISVFNMPTYFHLFLCFT